MRVYFTPQAIDDLDEIVDYIALDNLKRALSFSGELRQAAQKIGDAPYGFSLVDRERSADIRHKAYENYTIFYHVQRDQVEVLHIFHGARDYGACLFPEA